MSFEKFNLHEDIMSVLQEIGFEKPTPIQEQAMPLVREGRDLIGSAQTGTGKTAAFLLPTLDRLIRDENREKGFQVLILEPTRELAIQVQEHAERFCSKSAIRCQCVYGGVGMEPQKEAFKEGVEIVVATPGRLLDHFRQGSADASKLKVLILDEADRMLDMGFIPDVRSILRKLPADRQTLFFSATISGEVKRLSEDMLKNPAKIEIEPDLKTAAKVTQEAYLCPEHLKPFLLGQILEQEHVTSALIFTQTKVGADKVCAIVERHNMKVTKIHGDLGQAARQQALTDFKEGKVNILVATDVAARGIDVEGISHVINFNPPEGSDDYIHRIGRTARADKEGHAYTLFASAESMALGKIEKVIKQKIPRKTVKDFNYDEELGPQHEIRQGHNVAQFKTAGRGRTSSFGNKDKDGSASKNGGRNRGGRGDNGGRNRNGRKDEHASRSSSHEDESLAEITIKRSGAPSAPSMAPVQTPTSAEAPRKENPKKNRAGRESGRSKSKREYELEREKRQAAADLTAGDVLRNAASQVAVVDDSGLNLRPPIKGKTEPKSSEQRPETLPQEKLSGNRSQNTQEHPRPHNRNRNHNRNKNRSSNGDLNRRPQSENRDQNAAAENREKSNPAARTQSQTADGRPRRRRRRGGRGRSGRSPEGTSRNQNSGSATASTSRSGFLSKIKSFFSGK